MLLLDKNVLVDAVVSVAEAVEEHEDWKYLTTFLKLVSLPFPMLKIVRVGRSGSIEFNASMVRLVVRFAQCSFFSITPLFAATIEEWNRADNVLPSRAPSCLVDEITFVVTFALLASAMTTPIVLIFLGPKA